MYVGKTLKDWLPNRDAEIGLEHHLNKVIIEFTNNGWSWLKIGGWHKNVNSWVKLEDGTAVAWNENPSCGWSFPVLKIK